MNKTAVGASLIALLVLGACAKKKANETREPQAGGTPMVPLKDTTRPEDWQANCRRRAVYRGELIFSATETTNTMGNRVGSMSTSRKPFLDVFRGLKLDAIPSFAQRRDEILALAAKAPGGPRIVLSTELSRRIGALWKSVVERAQAHGVDCEKPAAVPREAERRRPPQPLQFKQAEVTTKKGRVEVSLVYDGAWKHDQARIVGTVSVGGKKVLLLNVKPTVTMVANLATGRVGTTFVGYKRAESDGRKTLSFSFAAKVFSLYNIVGKTGDLTLKVFPKAATPPPKSTMKPGSTPTGPTRPRPIQPKPPLAEITKANVTF